MGVGRGFEGVIKVLERCGLGVGYAGNKSGVGGLEGGGEGVKVGWVRGWV